MKQYLYTIALLLLCAVRVSAQTPATLGAPYAVVDGISQLHSFQIFNAEPGPLLDEVDAAVKRLNGQLVKVNAVAIDNVAVDALSKAIHARYANVLPVVTAAVGKLSRSDAKIGIDVVIAFKATPKAGVRVEDDPFGRVLHPSSRVYFSGQAERSDSAYSAAASTMIHLRDCLLSLDLNLDDVVQIRVFLTPIRMEKKALADLAVVLENRKIPIVFVDWKSSFPVEIELIASSSTKGPKPIEYIAPLGMAASPIYARVAKLNSDKTIYVGGHYGTSPGELKPDVEVKEVFAGLQAALDKTGSDMEHLVKATYLCSSEATSTQLNALRPNYYNPARPPAASKAIVAGVGMADRFFTMDMIATPK